MKYLFILLFGTINVLPSIGQSGKIRSLEMSMQQLHRAMLDADEKQLTALISDSLTYGHSGGDIDNKTSFIQHLVSGQTDFITMQTSDQVISIVDRAAWVRCNLQADIKDKGNQLQVKLKVLYVWIHQKGEWKLLARQAIK